MAREYLMGNGRITVALDNRMIVRDFFFPRVGLENHLSGHKFRIGVWTNNKFSWLDDNWEITIKYLPETLVSSCSARNDELDVELEVNDAVHNFLDLYLRKVTVKNLGNSKGEMRIFFSHDFHIYGVDAGDTVLYEPTIDSIIHYKRKRYFLIDGLTDQGGGINQFATGNKESFGMEGTWRDAEDGILEGNPVAQGSVDSVVSFRFEMQPKSICTIYYWIACGEKLEEVLDLDSKVKRTGVEQLLLETENYWSAWVNRQGGNLNVLPRSIRAAFKTSLLIMRAHVDRGGAIIASCDSDVLQFSRDTYSYVWPRDGALAALAFDMAGFQEVSRLFFRFCNDVISPKGYFHHKYLSDGSPGSSWHALVDSKGRPQLPIQEDETALVLYTLWTHFQKYRDLEFIGEVYPNLVVKAADFLLNYRDEKTGLPKPSFDLWEERMGIFTSTAATVCAGLIASSKFAKVFYDSKRQDIFNEAAMQMKEAMLTYLYDKQLGRFVKAIYPDGSRDKTMDSSLSFSFLYGPFDPGDIVVENTMKALINRLWLRTNTGGMVRYENDGYFQVSKDTPGNPWFVCTLWLARWYIAKASSLDELGKGLDLLHWTVKHSQQSGVLGEQLNPYTGAPISVSPLVWSHAEFVMAVCEYLDKYSRISSAT